MAAPLGVDGLQLSDPDTGRGIWCREAVGRNLVVGFHVGEQELALLLLPWGFPVKPNAEHQPLLRIDLGLRLGVARAESSVQVTS